MVWRGLRASLESYIHLRVWCACLAAGGACKRREHEVGQHKWGGVCEVGHKFTRVWYAPHAVLCSHVRH